MKLWFLLVFVALGVGCDEDAKPRESVVDSHGYIYLRDARGRCLALSPSIMVAGYQYAMSGQLQISVVPEAACGVK